jgi:hypothetical protein
MIPILENHRRLIRTGLDSNAWPGFRPLAGVASGLMTPGTPHLTLQGWCTSGYDAPGVGEYDSLTRALALMKRKAMPVPNRSYTHSLHYPGRVSLAVKHFAYSVK